MKNLFTLLFVFVSVICCAQNLVPNPSFEDTVACPINGRLYNCKYWINCGNTPDYNNNCAPSGTPFSVPLNNSGYQYASTGDAYCSIWTYAKNTFYRECLGAFLTQPMIKGHNYHISFKCSPGTLNGYSLQTNKLGMRFSTVPYDSIHPAPIDNFAHVYTGNIVQDTSNWTTVSANFTADSNYTFLVIGNFFNDNYTDTSSVKPFSFFAVYYIDDVEVIVSPEDVLSETNSLGKEMVLRDDGDSFKLISEKQMESIEIFNALGQSISKNLFPKSNYVIIYKNEFKYGIYLALIKIDGSYKIFKLIIN